MRSDAATRPNLGLALFHELRSIPCVAYTVNQVQAYGWLASGKRGVLLREILTDLYARSLLILDVFAAQALRLTPLWLAGVWLGATLAWVLAPRISRWHAPSSSGVTTGPQGWGLLLGSSLGMLSPFSLLSLAGFLRDLERQPRLRPGVVGFALASSLLDPTMFAFTLLALGPRLAALRILVALLAACLAGTAVLRRPPPPSNLDATTMHPNRSAIERSATGYMRHLGRYFAFSGRHYLLALLLTAWIQVLLPLHSWLSARAFRGPLEVLLAAGLGVPLYLCGGGAIALADGWLRSGMSQGAALAYLVVGAVTTPRALAGLLPLVGKRGAIILIVTAWCVAILAGLFLNRLP